MAPTNLAVVAANNAALSVCGRGDLTGWPAVIFLAVAGSAILFGISAMIYIERIKRK